MWFLIVFTFPVTALIRSYTQKSRRTNASQLRKLLVCVRRATRLRFPPITAPATSPSKPGIRTRSIWRAAMNRLILLVAFACLTSGIALATPQTAHEDVYSPFGPEWRSELNLYNGSYNLIKYVRKDDNMQHPNEVITIQNVQGDVKRSPEDEMSKVRARMEKNCHDGISQWHVVAQDAASFLVEWHANQCRYWPDQEQIARIIVGPHSWFLVTYSSKLHELTPDARAQWIKTLSEATFASI